MVGPEERRDLINRLGSESISALGTVLKCAASLLGLVIVAAGPWAILSETGPTADAATNKPATAQPQRALPDSEAESKRVFDERRRRYIEAHPDSQVASRREPTVRWQAEAYSDPGFQAWHIER